MMLTSKRTTSPIETLTDIERLGGSFNFSALSPVIQGLISDFEAPEYIAAPLAQRYNLDTAQQYGVARFIMEVVLHTIVEAKTISRLVELTGVEDAVAREMLQSIEENLLNPNGLRLVDLIRGAKEPTVALDARGKEGLRYATMNDLMRDLEPLSAQGRVKFLEDAKSFNRILVLQALSELKMGTAGGGQALTFRQLAAQEASRFTPQDWVDIIRTEPDVLSEPSVNTALAQTPLGVSLGGKNSVEARAIVARIAALPRDTQLLLVDPATAKTVSSLVDRGDLPATHVAAVTKLVLLLAVRDVVPTQTAEVLQKLGIPPASAATIAQTLHAITARKEEKTEGPRPVARVQARNVIDLRNKPSV